MSETTKCKKCRRSLGGITSGVPITTNSTICYERGTAEVRWADSGPIVYGHVCDACLAKVRDDRGRDPDHPDFGYPDD